MKLFLLPYLDLPLHSIAEVKVLADNVLTNPGHEIYLQDWMSELRFTPILLWRVGKVGKCIDPKFMARYLERATIGISFKADESSGKIPEQMMFGFDDSIVRSNLWWNADESDWDALRVRVIDKDELIEDQEANRLMYPNTNTIEESLAYISQYYLLKIGDLVAFPLWKAYRPIKANQGIFITDQRDEEVLYCGIK